ncbi:MAG: Ig domain-containing protein [Selenomonadaceae bacterium]|nr:Ig domain-containing protein [Selenomonadaceae bacterium]
MNLNIIAMKKIFAGIIFSVLVFTQILVSAAPQISYQAYVEGIGWQSAVSNGGTAGTTGQAQRMEAVRINLAGVEYCAHVQNIGWQEWKKSSEIAGTTGQNLRMEAVRIRLTGSAAEQFDIYYRAHVQNGGWLGWAKNGDPAGSAGAKLRMEALQIQIVPKGTNVQSGGAAFYERKTNLPTV